MDYDYSYEILNDGTLRLYQYEGTDTNIVVPDTIDRRKVTVLGNSTFQYCTQASDIESVTLPDSLTTIEKNAFYNCEKLKSVTIPPNVSFIGLAAFVEGLSESSLTEIKVDPENPYFSEKERSGIQQGWHKTDHVSVRTFRRLPDSGWNCKRGRLCFLLLCKCFFHNSPGKCQKPWRRCIRKLFVAYESCPKRRLGRNR